ncbi:MAG: hypothetical protein MUC49_02365 [Raineya sp.]|jgi:hypothetical protein|nr:hypothetical protein [Raineya sp.]
MAQKVTTLTNFSGTATVVEGFIAGSIANYGMGDVVVTIDANSFRIKPDTAYDFDKLDTFYSSCQIDATATNIEATFTY